MSHLIILHSNVPVVSHRVIAEHTGNKPQSLKELIDDHRQDFEEFGVIRFEAEKRIGRPTITYYLNEPQATLLLTYLRNSKVVRAFKVALVKEFYEMREALYNKQNNAFTAERIATLEQRIYALTRENTELRRAVNRITRNDRQLPKLDEKLAKLWLRGVIPELTRRLDELGQRIGKELGSVGGPYVRELEALGRFFREKPQEGGNFTTLGDTMFPHALIG